MAAFSSELRLFYGWTIVGVSFLTQFVVMGTVFYSYGILMKPLAQDLGASRLAVGLGLPILNVAVGLASPFVGRVIDRRGVRSPMLLGSVVLSVGFALLSRVSSLWQFYAAFGGVMALGLVLLGPLPNTALVANWFARRRGTALGIAQIGVSSSGMVMAFATSALIAWAGWRGTSAVFAVLPVLLLAPLIARLVVNRPEDRGELPDGDPPSESELRRAELSAAVSRIPAWTAKGALRERNLWLIASVVGLNFACLSAVLIQIYPDATDRGFSSEQAAAVLAAMAGTAALGKPLFGWLGDRVPVRAAMWLAIALQMAGLALLMRAPSYPSLFGAALLFGVGYGGVMPLWGVLIGAVYGRAVFGRIMGLMAPVMIPFQTLSVPFSGWIFDRTGSYEIAFATFLGVYALSAGILLFLRTGEENGGGERGRS